MNEYVEKEKGEYRVEAEEDKKENKKEGKKMGKLKYEMTSPKIY